MAAGVFEYASLMLLNALLGALVLARAHRSWLARTLGFLFFVNVIPPFLDAADAGGFALGSTTYFRLMDLQSFLSLIALALIPGLVYRETTGGGRRLILGLAIPAIAITVAYAATRFLFPTQRDPALTYALQLMPFAFVIVIAVVALLDLAIRLPDPRSRVRAHFFLAAYTLATLTTFEISSEFTSRTPFEAFVSPLLYFALICALLLPLGTFIIQRLRHLAGGPGPTRLSGLEWMLLLTIPALSATLSFIGQPKLGYELVRPILFTSGILAFGIAGDGRTNRPLAAVAVVVAAGAASLWMAALWPAPAIAPLVGVAIALALLWPLAKEALGHDASQNPRTLYEAALVASIESGASEDAPVLKTLRSRLGISEKEHGVLEMRARERGAEGIAPQTRLFGRYRIERRIGAGATGATYLATDEELDRQVSLKIAQFPTEEGAQRLLAEARTLARLRHANIPRLFDVERIGLDVLLVLEYVEGESLEARLKRGPLPPREGIRIAEDVLSALATLHAEGLVHRDIKPSNVILSSDGHAHLIDYGIATDVSRTLTSQEGSSLPAGTFAYMAPEQLLRGVVDARSDLFSLAATLYESLCGETYFPLAGRDLQEVAAAIARDRPRFPAELPRPLAAWLLRALEKDPAARPSSAREMLGELQRAGAA